MHVYTLIRWLALRVGKKQRSFANQHEYMPGQKLARGAHCYSYNNQYKIILALRPNFIGLPVHEFSVEEVDEDGILTDSEALNYASSTELWHRFPGGDTFCARRDEARAAGESSLKEFNDREWSMRTDILLTILRREMRELSRKWKELNGE